nr:uncharacterized protein LOC112060228 isoform X1 [Chrysemys picta bellii]
MEMSIVNSYGSLFLSARTQYRLSPSCDLRGCWKEGVLSPWGTPPVTGWMRQAHLFRGASDLVGIVQDIGTCNLTYPLLPPEDFSVMAEPPTYTPGSPIRVEAKVESSAGVSPRIYVDECYGSHAEHLSHSRRIYVIVNNHGCLHGGKSGDVAVWCRPEDSALQFATPAFMLADEPEEKIYIHCLLTAWGQESLTSLGKKSCYYNSTSFSWQNLEDPSQNLKCSCCDSHCPADSAPPGELREFVGEGMLHRKIAGPLMVHKEEAPWYEERCRTLKKLLLVGVAFVGSCLVGALFVGGLLALALALFRSYQRSKGQRLLRKRKEYPYQTELQSVVNALVTAEEMQKAERESSIDYNLNTDASEKE